MMPAALAMHRHHALLLLLRVQAMHAVLPLLNGEPFFWLFKLLLLSMPASLA
jgi:hypothetical protein